MSDRYSHHTVGTLAVDLALALGASIIEVHYTDNRDQSSFRDHQLSFQYEELCELKKRMTEIPKIPVLQKKPTQSEVLTGHLTSFRRSLYAKKYIPKGKQIEWDDLVALSPCLEFQLSLLKDYW